MVQEEGKKYSQLIKIKNFSDSALIAVYDNGTELNTILFEDFKNNKLVPIFATKEENNSKLSIENIIAGENIELIKQDNNVTISSKAQSDPSVLQALQYINGSEVLKDEYNIENIEKQGGSIKLQTNNIYKINVLNQDTYFIPPTIEEIDNNIHNQIQVYFNYSKIEEAELQPKISFGDNVQFVNGLTINFEINKNYRVIYDFNPIQQIWICGVIMNQETVY